MLGKLLKYDLKWNLKFLSIFYILTLFFAILTRIFINIENSFFMDIVGKICTGATISLIFNIIVNNTFRLWANFRQKVYGDESYLTHTLPVKKSSIYFSKMLAAVISLFISFLVIIFALFVAYYSKDGFESLRVILNPIFNSIKLSFTGALAILILVLFLELLNMLQCGFTGVIIGHRFNNAKIGFSVLFGFITYMISQAIILVLLFIPAIFNSNFMNLFFTTDTVSPEIIKFVIILSTISYLLLVILGFFINKKLFSKGVNVD